MIIYRTKEGDMVDAIAYRHYGHHVGTTEAILNANHGLADHGLSLPAGLLITLPELGSPAAPAIDPDTLASWS